MIKLVYCAHFYLFLFHNTNNRNKNYIIIIIIIYKSTFIVCLSLSFFPIFLIYMLVSVLAPIILHTEVLTPRGYNPLAPQMNGANQQPYNRF